MDVLDPEEYTITEPPPILCENAPKLRLRSNEIETGRGGISCEYRQSQIRNQTPKIVKILKLWMINLFFTTLPLVIDVNFLV